MCRKTWLIFVCTAVALSLAGAADLAGDPSGLWKPFSAIFKIHSGIVSDRTPPTAKDRKLTVNVDGGAAREIFESIGPDIQPTCNGTQGDRDRRRKGIYCTFDPSDLKAKGGALSVLDRRQSRYRRSGEQRQLLVSADERLAQ